MAFNKANFNEPMRSKIPLGSSLEVEVRDPEFVGWRDREKRYLQHCGKREINPEKSEELVGDTGICENRYVIAGTSAEEGLNNNQMKTSYSENEKMGKKLQVISKVLLWC